MAEGESVPCANIMAGWAVWITPCNGEVITAYPITPGLKRCQPLCQSFSIRTIIRDWIPFILVYHDY